MEPGDKLIKKPVYPGGRKAMSTFLKENMVYPERAKQENIEGLVMVYIDIDGKGNVVRTRLKKKLGYGCDEEAVRLVKLLKFFVTNKRKVRLTHHKNIKIYFKLDQIKSAPETTKPAAAKSISVKPRQVGKTSITTPGSMQIVYTYVPKKK